MARTGRPKAKLVLTDQEQATLVGWSRRAKSSQALAQRSRIVLACAEGDANTQVASELGYIRRRWASGAPGLWPGAWTGWWMRTVRAGRRRSPLTRSRMWWWRPWRRPQRTPRTGHAS